MVKLQCYIDILRKENGIQQNTKQNKTNVTCELEVLENSCQFQWCLKVLVDGNVEI